MSEHEAERQLKALLARPDVATDESNKKQELRICDALPRYEGLAVLLGVIPEHFTSNGNV